MSPKPLYKKKRVYFSGMLMVLLVFSTHQAFSWRPKDKQALMVVQIQNYIAMKNPRIPIPELVRLSEAIITYAPQLRLPTNAQINGQVIQKEFFLTAIIYTESSFYRYARSRVGAQGYMQIMPETASWLASLLRIRHIRKKIWQPEVNLRLGVRFINMLIEEMGSLKKALLAYNAGPTAVRQWGGVPRYWHNIVAYYQEIQALTQPKPLPELAALE